ncbi:MAG: hypothetical protein WBB82_18040 [Limnothrix sp.]
MLFPEIFLSQFFSEKSTAIARQKPSNHAKDDTAKLYDSDIQPTLTG